MDMNAETLNTPAPALRPSPFGQALAALDRAVTALLLLSVAVMVSVVAAQVALRYGLNRSIDWADEVGRLAFVWSIFLAIPLGVRQGVAHRHRHRRRQVSGLSHARCSSVPARCCAPP